MELDERGVPKAKDRLTGGNTKGGDGKIVPVKLDELGRVPGPAAPKKAEKPKEAPDGKAGDQGGGQGGESDQGGQGGQGE